MVKEEGRLISLTITSILLTSCVFGQLSDGISYLYRESNYPVGDVYTKQTGLSYQKDHRLTPNNYLDSENPEVSDRLSESFLESVGYPLLLRLLGFYGFAAETPLYVRAALMKLGFWILIVAAQIIVMYAITFSAALVGSYPPGTTRSFGNNFWPNNFEQIAQNANYAINFWEKINSSTNN